MSSTTGIDSGEIRFARGNAKLPLEPHELKAKFLDCAASAGNLDARALYERLDHLDGLDSLRDLMRQPLMSLSGF